MLTTAGAGECVLDVRDLRMRYGRGEVLALLGPNGAGKTTTIEILEGFRMPSAGQVSVLGTGRRPRSCSPRTTWTRPRSWRTGS